MNEDEGLTPASEAGVRPSSSFIINELKTKKRTGNANKIFKKLSRKGEWDVARGR